ncbi:MAG: pilus assembly protein TadG-related protein, partial [Thermoanaerobaculia bacterium]
MSFAKDQSGAVLPMVTVSLITLIGFATLAVDLSRLMDLQTQLQKAADAFAIAGAAELDGGADAITRADAAIDALMAGQNSSVWGGVVTVSSRTYHATLPATDDLAMGGGGAAAGDARYVEVVVTPVTVNTFLPATLLGAVDNTLTTGATAVAGFTQV